MDDRDVETLFALLRAAGRGDEREARALRDEWPELPALSVHVAAALLDREAVEGHLAADAARAVQPGPAGVLPIRLACGSRLADDTRAAEVARALLAAGADPNDGRSLFTALEQDRVQLLATLLEHGGDPMAGDRERGQGLLHFAAEACWRPRAVALLLERGEDPNARWGPFDETVLHVAVRRRRLDAVETLLANGADVNARTRNGDTAWRHALRRPFPEVAAHLARAGASTETRPADDLAVALVLGELEAAEPVLAAHPTVATDLCPEEARLLGDLAGQGNVEAVAFLLDHGADREARGLDGGTPLQQSAWFGTPEVTRLLLERGADVHATGCDHDSTPLGWAVHGSRYSGGAEERQEAYLDIVEQLLAAGATLELPGDPPDRPGARMLADASERVRERLLERFPEPAEDS